ncbi:MAG: hypothetical protein LQ339_001790 [Xanthoria mediterranea]|nr:MAG: hypothetical protein LQ339_001790 [Xanthoria mediterranea]
MRACSVLLEEPTELRFDGDVQWDVHALSADFTTWMTDEDGLTTATSRVGILSDTEFQQILQQYLDDDVCMHLRLLVKIFTLLYNRQEDPHPRLTPQQLIQMRSTIGIRLLQSLEAALKHTALQAASKDKLEGLFLVVVGVIIATKYTSMNGHEEARHEHLRVLAHYMVLIGDRIGLLHCLTIKRRLVENCHNLWNKPGNFEWDYGNSSTKEVTEMSTSTASRPDAVHTLRRGRRQKRTVTAPASDQTRSWPVAKMQICRQNVAVHRLYWILAHQIPKLHSWKLHPGTEHQSPGK